MIATLEKPQATEKFLSARQRIDAISAELWDWPHEKILDLIGCQVPKFKLRFGLETLIGENLCTVDEDGLHPGHGWWVIDPTGGANSIPAGELPECMALDVESTKEHNKINKLSETNDYHPFLAVAYGIPEGHDDPVYYVWVGPRDNSQRLIEMPKDRIIITFNGGAHDSKFLSCEYEGEPLPIIHVDVMALLTMWRGICDDKQQAAYQQYAANTRAGKSAPDWFAHATTTSLEDAARNVLGMPIVKGIDTTDPDAPQNVIEYCAQDIAITVKILQRIYKLLYNRFIASPATWVGMAASMGLAIYLEDSWPSYCSDFAQVAEESPRATAKAWLSYHQHEYAKLYINDGAAKVGMNPVGDPISRFPKSGVWCHKHSDAFPAFNASQEDGFAVDVKIEIPEEFAKFVDSDANAEAYECGHSLLLGVRTAESIEYESPRRRAELIKRYKKESLPTDLLHAALTIINYEIMEHEIDARVSDFRVDYDCLFVGIMGSKEDSEVITKIKETTEKLCSDLCSEVLAEMGVPF